MPGFSYPVDELPNKPNLTLCYTYKSILKTTTGIRNYVTDYIEVVITTGTTRSGKTNRNSYRDYNAVVMTTRNCYTDYTAVVMTTRNYYTDYTAVVMKLGTTTPTALQW